MTSLQQEQAHACLRELIKHVFEHSVEDLDGLTYQELARRIDRLNKHGQGHGHGIGAVLGIMGHLLQNLEGGWTEWGESVPHIQSLVVQKSGTSAGLPDEGIKEFWPEYPRLSREEKRNKVRAEYFKVAAFGSRWNEVLRRLGLDEVKWLDTKEVVTAGIYGRGGESPEHKALKKYVVGNPGLVGLTGVVDAIPEYRFPSMDAVDVLFKTEERWLAVEVKSRISDRMVEDYERGLYQCIKYKALLEGMQADHRYLVPDRIEVILVLETVLPKRYLALAEALDINVVEGVIFPLLN